MVSHRPGFLVAFVLSPRTRAISILTLLLAWGVAASALDAAALHALVAHHTPEEIWAAADSLEDSGAISSAEASGLRVFAANAPGYWERFATSLDSLCAAAAALPPDGVEASREDSIWYFSVLLNEAYFHARASVDSPQAHARGEEHALRVVLANAPVGWQRMRAAMELGRMYRFRSALHSSEADSADAARRYLDSVAWAAETDDSRAVALWQLAWLEAETGTWDRARVAADEMRGGFQNTKWEERSRIITAMEGRRELGIARVAAEDGYLVVAGTARNLDGPLTLTLARIDPAWVQRHGRIPLAGERVRVSDRRDATTDLAARTRGVVWEVSLPALSHGFYRLEVSVADTMVASTMGMLNVELGADETRPECVENESPFEVTVYAGQVSPRARRPDFRLLEPGGVWCADQSAPTGFVVYDDACAGWCGPRHAGPAWLVRVDHQAAIRGAP